MALAGPVLPERLRTTGIALIQTGQALAYLVSSVLFGLAWQAWGPADRRAGSPPSRRRVLGDGRHRRCCLRRRRPTANGDP